MQDMGTNPLISVDVFRGISQSTPVTTIGLGHIPLDWDMLPVTDNWSTVKDRAWQLEGLG